MRFSTILGAALLSFCIAGAANAHSSASVSNQTGVSTEQFSAKTKMHKKKMTKKMAPSASTPGTDKPPTSTMNKGAAGKGN